MNYMASHQGNGPSRKGISQMIFYDKSFKESLETEFIPKPEQATTRIIDSVRELINNIYQPDKILEILRKLHPEKEDEDGSFVGSDLGYIRGGKKECQDVIKKYLREQIHKYKREQQTIQKNITLKT